MFLDDGQNVGKWKRRTLKREAEMNVREFWFFGRSCHVTFCDNDEVKMSRNVTLKKWRMESILSIPTNGLYNATPILMRYKVKFTFEIYRYSIKYL